MNEYSQPAQESRLDRSARFFTVLQRYRNVLRRRWWLLLLMTLLGMIVNVLIIWNAPPAFASYGQMIMNVRLQLQTGASYYEEMNNFLGTQVALMQSGTVLERAQERIRAAKPELLPTKVDLKIGVSPKTTIFNLRAVGSDPVYTQAYLDAIMDEYVSLKKDMRAKSSSTTLQAITEELVRLEKELKGNEDELLSFQATNSVVFLQEQGNSAGTYLAQLNRDLAKLQTELQLLNLLNLEQNLERQQQLAATAATTTTGDSDSAKDVSKYLPPDSEYLKAKQAIQLLKAEAQQMSVYLRPLHPKMVMLLEDIERKEGLLEVFKQQSVEQLDNRRSSLELQIQNIERDMKDWEARSLDVNSKMVHYEKLRKNIDRVQTLYDQLLKTMQAVGVDKDISPETVTILAKASPAFPDRPTFSKQKLPPNAEAPSLVKSLLIAAVIGLALGVGILILTDRFDDRMNSFVELHDHFDESVIGQIPRERHPKRSSELQLIQPDDTRHAFVEAYRNMRSSLLFMSHNNGDTRPTLLLVTSSIPNDGKSMTTANLAITMAGSGSRVLLVDADLRKGVMHRRFKLKSTPGFTEVLRQEANWRDIVQPTHVESLFLLSCGSTSHKSSEMFLQASTAELLREMAKEYDYVIVDTAPVMAADDVTSLAPLMQGVIFVIRAGQTSARVARASLDLLYQRNVNVLGLVFNAVNPDVADYYYYSKYKDYYSKPKTAKAAEPAEPAEPVKS